MTPLSEKWNRQNRPRQIFQKLPRPSNAVRRELDWLVTYRLEIDDETDDVESKDGVVRKWPKNDRQSNTYLMECEPDFQMSKKWWTDAEYSNDVAGSPKKWSLIFFSVASRWHAKFSVAEPHRMCVQLYVCFSIDLDHLYSCAKSQMQLWSRQKQKHYATRGVRTCERGVVSVKKSKNKLYKC